jgi:hypothetical protein
MNDLNLPQTPPGEIVTETTLTPTTLGELGGTLPQTRQAFRFHPPTMGTMKRLGALDADGKLRKHPGRYLAYFLGGALAELGGKDCGAPGATDTGATLVLALPVGDVFALMLAWKRTTTPKGADLGAGECGKCGAPFGSMVLDLGEIQVLELPEGAEAPAARVGLYSGFPFPAGQVVRTVLVKPPTWGESFAALPASGWSNPAALTMATIQAAIAAVDTTKAPRVPTEALDELTQEDAELINEALERISPTPDLVMEVDCPACQHTNQHRIDWKDVGFFGGSGRR